MKKLTHLLYVILLFGLVACAAAPVPSALPENQTRWFRAEQLDADGGTRQTLLLSVQGLAGGESRWLLADVFGAPQARLIAGARGWRADGFAPPNREAQRLFAAMIPHLQQGFSQPATLSDKTRQWRITPIESP